MLYCAKNVPAEVQQPGFSSRGISALYDIIKSCLAEVHVLHTPSEKWNKQNNKKKSFLILLKN